MDYQYRYLVFVVPPLYVATGHHRHSAHPPHGQKHTHPRLDASVGVEAHAHEMVRIHQYYVPCSYFFLLCLPISSRRCSHSRYIVSNTIQLLVHISNIHNHIYKSTKLLYEQPDLDNIIQTGMAFRKKQDESKNNTSKECDHTLCLMFKNV
jgi:hypothetical protein